MAQQLHECIVLKGLPLPVFRLRSILQSGLLVLTALRVHAVDQDAGTHVVPRMSAQTEAPAPTEFLKKEVLVSANDLEKMLGKREVVVIDARNQENYLDGHIPGARNIESDSLQNPDSPPYYMPTSEKLKSVCDEMGIPPSDQPVVIYDDDDGRLAARIWFTLHAYGHEQVSILDGGVAKWKEKSRGWTTEVRLFKQGRCFEPKNVLRGVCAFADLSQFRTRAHILGQLPVTTMIDARSLAEYMGEEVRGKTGGHVPGAANIEWSALLTGKEHERVWRSPPEIHAILRVAGVSRDQKIAIYDQAGGRSAHLYFTLWLMGFEKSFNYVAGWREYGNRDDVEIEK